MPDSVRLGRDVCGVLDDALRREWLVTGGTGGYAMGTVAGGLTRRYHALLVAATEPPMGRIATVAGMSEAVLDGAAGAGGAPLYLHTQEWGSGAVEPRGHVVIESFELEGQVPTWRYAVPGGVLEKRIWMKRGSETTFLTYTLTRTVAGTALSLALRPMCTWRDHHALGRAGALVQVDAVEDGLAITFAGAPTYWVRAAGAEVTPDGEWYRDLHLRDEAERGMVAVQDLYVAGTLRAPLLQSATVAVSISLDPSVRPADAAASQVEEAAHGASLLRAAGVSAESPAWVPRLVLAADQFVTARAGLSTVLAGFPWFGDWGRDTMISLPGLALATGRPSIAASLLRGFARYVDHGLLPNRFPDFGETPQYNTVDATLWYVEALRSYVAETGDDALVRELWPVLSDIVSWHVRGTRHGISVDMADGLLRAGEPGVQLTWMDAMVDGWVVTPRTGKPVEISALWHNALCCMEEWMARLDVPAVSGVDVAGLRAQVGESFGRYWNPATGYLYDVLDGPSGDDASVRPNAVIAASLHHTPLSRARIAAVVSRAQRDLLTSLGLRSLAPESPGYVAAYLGDLRTRDGAYHQGTVWPWLIGPFAVAHLRAFNDAAVVRSFLEPLADHLRDAGIGSVSEIADASPPHTPRGCPWQAWSVAELLRVWRMVAPAEPSR
jgi:predicted glycogen debranching enzyme